MRPTMRITLRSSIRRYEPAESFISNANAWEWMVANVPLFSCPDAQLEEIYYFRWWTFRKHIRQTPHGFVVTEFLAPVKHAGPYNTISCAFGHHLAEGSWLRDRRPLDDYTRFWFRSGANGGPAVALSQVQQLGRRCNLRIVTS